MVSSLTVQGAEVTLRALELGAVDFLAKPSSDLASSFGESALEICAKVKLAAKATPRARTAVRKLEVAPRLSARSEEHTSELQSLMRTSDAVFCLKKNNY